MLERLQPPESKGPHAAGFRSRGNPFSQEPDTAPGNREETNSPTTQTGQNNGSSGTGNTGLAAVSPISTQRLQRMITPLNAANVDAPTKNKDDAGQETQVEEAEEPQEKPAPKIETEHIEPEEPPETDEVLYGSDVEIFKELTAEQKERYQWDLAFKMFREVNPGIPERTLSQWIRKQLMHGWSVNDAFVPDIRQIVITPVTHYWKGKPFQILYVQAYSFDEAYAATGDYNGFWYWITPILGNKSKLQQHGSVTAYNRKTFGNLDRDAQITLMGKLYAVSGDKAAYDKAMTSGGIGGLEFAALVKSAQRKFWGNDPDRVTGMLAPLTSQKVEGIVETQTMERTESFKDNPDTLLSKLFYISGDLELYRNAMQEKLANESPGVANARHEALSKLIQSAQEVLFENYSLHTGTLDARTYREIDQWGKTFGGNIQSMDNVRLQRLAQRTYNTFAGRRNRLEQQIRQKEVIYSNQQEKGINGWATLSELTDLRAELKKYEWASIVASYNYRRIASHEYTYRISMYPQTTDKAEYPEKNPFAKPGEINALMPSSYNLQLPFVTDPDRKRRSDTFYNSFKNAPQATVKSQVTELDLGMFIKRNELLNAETDTPGRESYATMLKLFGENRENNAFMNQPVRTTAIQPYENRNIIPAVSDQIARQTEYLHMSEDKNLPDNSDLVIRQEKTEEFKRLVDEINLKAARIKGSNPKLAEYLYAAGSSLSAYNFPGSGIADLQGLKRNGGNYTPKELLDITGELLDMHITNRMLPQGNVTADALKNMRQRRDYLSEKQRQTDERATTVPAYLVLDEVEKDTRQYLHSPGRRLTKQENTLLEDGIALSVFVLEEHGEYTMWIDLGGKLKKATASASGYNAALHELFDELESDNLFPNGRIYYTDGNREIQSIATSGDHWTWSELLGAISIALLIAAIPFTGGSSAYGAYLIGAATLTGIASEGMSLYEKSEVGTLTGSDVAISSLSILASLLPGIGTLGKMGKVGRAGGRAAFLEGKAFLVTTYAVGATDAAVQGYLLTSDFIQAYDSLPEGLNEEERQHAVMRLLFNSLAFGLLTYHSFRSDVSSLGNLYETQVHPDRIGSITRRSAEMRPGSSFDLPYSRERTVIQLTLGDQELDNMPRLTEAGQEGNVLYSKYAVSRDGTVTFYTRETFLKSLNEGKFDAPELTVSASITDAEVQKAMNGYRERTKSFSINHQIADLDRIVNYTNPQGSKLFWNKPSKKSIQKSIESSYFSEDPGRQVEAKVAYRLIKNGISIEAFNLKVKNAESYMDIGDIDIMTTNYIIEIKKSYASFSSKPDQILKFSNPLSENFMNAYEKRIILYIDKELTELQRQDILSKIPKNVLLINSLDHLVKLAK